MNVRQRVVLVAGVVVVLVAASRVLLPFDVRTAVRVNQAKHCGLPVSEAFRGRPVDAPSDAVGFWATAGNVCRRPAQRRLTWALVVGGLAVIGTSVAVPILRDC